MQVTWFLGPIQSKPMNMVQVLLNFCQQDYILICLTSLKAIKVCGNRKEEFAVCTIRPIDHNLFLSQRSNTTLYDDYFY